MKIAIVLIATIAAVSWLIPGQEKSKGKLTTATVYRADTHYNIAADSAIIHLNNGMVVKLYPHQNRIVTRFNGVTDECHFKRVVQP